MIQLDAEHVLTIIAELTDDVIVGDTFDGYLKVIPITGGTVSGKIKGTVIPGGADWNTTLKNNHAHVFAKYMFKTDDGEIITIQNEGVFNRDAGQNIKTTQKFIAREDGNYDWINNGVYVGSINRLENYHVRAVEIKIFKLY